MKTFRHYLAESARTYNYTIKVLGDCDDKFWTMFKHNLSKFDPVKLEEPKSTPVQKNPYGFPDAENESVHIMKVEFRYPATEPMIQQCAQASGCQINRVRVLTTDFADSVDASNEKIQNQYDTSKDKALLTQEVMADDGKQASQDYANQYLDKVVPKQPSIDIPYEGQKTPTAKNTSKEGINTVSAMGNGKVKMPEKPATGARR